MKRFLIPLLGSALAFATMATSGNAGSRYATPPPLTLSSDLTSPWTLQLKPKRRVASKRERARYRRPKGLKPLRTKAYRAPSVSKRRTTMRSGTVRASAAHVGSNGLRHTISINREAELMPTIVAYQGSERPGDIIINTIERRLYLVMPGGKARRYAVGVGRPGFEWAGTHKVTRKTEWPSWRPPKEMIARERKKGNDLPAFMPGGIENPLGARALYLGSTLYRIHGTNQAWSIGKAVSSGCIRMRNEDVMDLYDRVGLGTKVRVI